MEGHRSQPRTQPEEGVHMHGGLPNGPLLSHEVPCLHTAVISPAPQGVSLSPQSPCWGPAQKQLATVFHLLLSWGKILPWSPYGSAGVERPGWEGWLLGQDLTPDLWADNGLAVSCFVHLCRKRKTKHFKSKGLERIKMRGRPRSRDSAPAKHEPGQCNSPQRWGETNTIQPTAHKPLPWELCRPAGGSSGPVPWQRELGLSQGIASA